MTRHLAAAAVLAVLAFAIYAGSVDYPFQFDDALVVSDNPDIQRATSVYDVFLVPNMVPENRTGAGFYRPVLFSSYAMNHAASGLDPAPYRITDIILHVVNSFFVYIIAWLALGPGTRRYWPLVAAALFCVHPVQTGSVIFITARSVVLLATFCMASLAAYIRYRETGSKYLLAVSALAYALAVLTKESAIPFAGVFVIVELHYSRASRGNGGGFRWKPLVPHFAAAAAFVVSRAAFMTSSQPNDGRSLDMLTHWMTAVSAIPGYIGLLLIPTGLSVDHYVPAVTSLADANFLLGTVILATWAASIAVCVKRWPLMAAFAAWPLFVMLPEMVVPLKDVMVDYRLYLPFAGVMLSAALLLERIPSGMPVKAAFVVSAVLIVVLGTASFTRSKVWADPYTLWQDALEKTDGMHPRPYTSLGREYAMGGDFKTALAYLEKAVELDPEGRESYVNLGNVYAETGDMKKAVRMQKKAISVNPGYFTAYSNLAKVYRNMGDYESAYNTYIEMAGLFRRTDYLLEAADYFTSRRMFGYADGLLAKYHEKTNDGSPTSR